MRIWRIEHECEQHGPVSQGSCTTDRPFFGDQPRYGCVLEPSSSDPLIDIQYPHEVCGTLPDQFNRWWEWSDYSWEDGYHGTPNIPDTLPEGWWAKEFEVSAKFVRIGHNQVVFVRSKATEVFRTNKRGEWPAIITLPVKVGR